MAEHTVYFRNGLTALKFATRGLKLALIKNVYTNDRIVYFDHTVNEKGEPFNWQVTKDMIRNMNGLETVSHDDLVSGVEKLMDYTAEKRSDICDILQMILWGDEINEGMVEHRYISKTVKVGDSVIEIQYDTLTTYMETRIDGGEWTHGEEVYSNDM